MHGLAIRTFCALAAIFVSSFAGANSDSSSLRCERIFSQESSGLSMMPHSPPGHILRGTIEYETFLDRYFSASGQKRSELFDEAGFSPVDFVERPPVRFRGQDLSETIARTGTRNVTELMTHLPPRLMGSALFVSHSRSTQFASPEKPRVILHNNDASFIMALSGDRERPGYNSIEVMEFNKASRSFHLSVIHLPESTEGNGKIKVEKEPKRCLGCHGGSYINRTVHPIWDTYPTWPGNYGSSEIVELNESRSMARFRELAVNDPFYSQFPAVRDANFRDRTDSSSYFTVKINELNGDQIAATLIESPNFRRYVKALDFAFREYVDETIEAMPEHNKAALRARYSAMLERTSTGTMTYLRDKLQRIERIFPLSDADLREIRYGDRMPPMRGIEREQFLEGENEKIALLRFVAEAMGIETQHWALNKVPDQIYLADNLLGDVRRIQNSFNDQLLMRYGTDSIEEILDRH